MAAAEKMAEAGALIRAVTSGGGQHPWRVSTWFAGASPDERTFLLDGLARQAARSPEAREVLLTVVAGQRLAMPAIHRLILDPDNAEDVEQEVLVAVARALPGFRGDAQFTTWLHTVARNTAIAAIRRRRDTTVLDGGAASDPRRLSSFIATSVTVRSAVDVLPPNYREALILRDLERHSYQEIADRLGLNLNTVRTRIRRARALLALSLEAVPPADAAPAGPADAPTGPGGG